MGTKGLIRALGLAAFLASFFGVSLGFAATLKVPSQFPTIQSAISAAATGDTILVAAGAYQGGLDFTGKTLSLVSEGGATATTIVGTAAPVLTFDNNDRSTVVSGFTIQSPPNTTPSVMLSDASPTLTDNRFVGGDDRTVAIEGYGTSVLLERNLFTGWNEGGNTNSVVSLSNFVAPIIRDNVFFNNGSALFLSSTANNSLDVSNNTFVDDDLAIWIEAFGGGDDLIVRNNIIYGALFGIEVSLGNGAVAPLFRNNLAFGNNKNYVGIADQTGTNGNIEADPQLGGVTAMDFHPDKGSPTIDAGLNEAVSKGDTDFYRAQRIRAGASGNAIVDIGAVEYVGVQPTVTLELSATSILLGSTVTISWSSTNATNCEAGGAWSGSLPLSGTQVLTPRAGNLTYTVSCANSAATRLQSAKLTVNPPPTANVAVSPTTVYQGQDVAVTWSSTAATSCAASGGGWAGPLPSTSGNTTDFFETGGTYTLILTCTGPGGTAVASATVTVISGPTLTFSATDIPVGGTTVLTWAAFPKATSCTASGAWSGPVATSGSKVIGPVAAGEFAFELTCTGAGVTVSTTQYISAYIPDQLEYQSHGLAGADAGIIYAVAAPGTVPVNGGLDGLGDAYSSDTLPYPVTSLGQSFYIGAVSQPTGDSSQTISVGPDFLANVTILATGVDGNQTNQKFVVEYSDGSSTTYTQSLSDWHHPQNYAGETVAAATTYRITQTGEKQSGTYNLYAYRIPLDSTKVATSLKLPNNRHVVVLAVNVTLAPMLFENVFSSVFNLTGLAASGDAPSNGGLDGLGNAYASDVLTSTVTWSGQQFPMGPPNQLSAVTNSTIALTQNYVLSLTILASGVNGDQPDQTFLVTYVDGSTTAFQQSLSDWHHPQNYSGESIALRTPYRITATGAQQAGSYNLYAYTFQTDETKAISSLTLPKNRNVVVLAVDSLTR